MGRLEIFTNQSDDADVRVIVLPEGFSKFSSVKSKRAMVSNLKPRYPSAGKIFSELPHYNEHREEQDEKPFRCSFCHYRASQRDHLDNHFRKHTGETPFSCCQCDQKYRTKAMLDRHTRNAHEYNGKKPLSCTIPKCLYRTTQKDYLEAHMKRHGVEHVKSVPCPLCPKKFFTETMMMVHLRCHTGEKPYVCNYCDYQAKQPSGVRMHMRKCKAFKSNSVTNFERACQKRKRED